MCFIVAKLSEIFTPQNVIVHDIYTCSMFNLHVLQKLQNIDVH